MKQPLQLLKCYLLQKKHFAFFVLLFLLSGTLKAQTIVSTTSSFTNDSTVGVVTFNFQNTNSYPVVINNIEGLVSDFGLITTTVWYKSGAITGPPGVIGTANGWTLSASNNIYGFENIANTSVTQPFFINGILNLTIPANTTYGIAIAAYDNASGVPKLRVGNSAPSVNVSAGGCNFITGSNIGYSDQNYLVAPTTAPKGWLGKINFINGAACSGTPNTPVISGPSSICSNAMFSLTSTGTSAGVGFNYMWQKYNTATSTWDDILGAITTTYNCPGITAASQFRLKTTCTGSGLVSYSNTVTITIGAGLAAGTYTINQLSASTSTNFISYNAAAAALQCGVTGPVTINVIAGSGPYNEMVTFGKIPGSSAINKIRINGRNQVIQHNSPSDTGVVNLNGTKYITFDSLTVRELSPFYGIGFNVMDSASHDTISHCFVDMRSVTAVASNSAGISQGGWYNNNYLDNTDLSSSYIGYNYILGTYGPDGMWVGIDDGGYYYNGYYNSANDTGNVVEHNTIENFAYIGIIANGSNGTSISYNDIHRTNKQQNTSAYSFVGIDCRSDDNYNYLNTDTVRDYIKIVGNRIHDPSPASNYYGFTGIQIGSYYWNNLYTDAGSDFLVANNVIYNVNFAGNTGGSLFGIYMYGGNNFNNVSDNDTFRIYHNTIDFSQANTNGSGQIVGIYYNDVYAGNNTDDQNAYVYNNLVTITSSGPATKYGFTYYFYNNPNLSTTIRAQRNNYYVNSTGGTQYYGRYNNTNFNNLTDFHTAYPSLEVGSLTVDPTYLSPATGDFTPTNLALMGNGKDLQNLVPKDILGRPRPIAPTPGAFEIGRDAGVTTLLSPVGTYCSSIKMVSVLIKNFGLINIDNVQIGWSLNGVVQPPVSYGTVMLPGGTAAINLGNGLFMPSSAVTIKAWTYLPNGIPDGYPTNDTLTITTQSSTSVPVNIGPDDSICTGNTLTLDAGFPGSQYVWDNSTYNQTRTIQNAGTYYVKVTAFDGCIGVDTMKLTLRPLPIVDLGPQKAICEGSTTTLDAGNPGNSYLWDDGSTQQTRVVDTAGYYEVHVTDHFGCTGVDNVEVIMKDMPTVDGINATHADSGVYTFYPLNPMYVITYKWDFGDGSPEEIGYMVQHAYLHNGIYTVTLSMVGECTGLIIKQARTVDVFSAPADNGGGTGINNPALEGAINIYPNPSSNILKIENKSDARMNRVVVYSALGQIIINEATSNVKQHQLSTAALANGLYSIRVETDKGSYIQKFEVMR